MLPTGPRYSYQLPSSPQAGARDLAKQILSSIHAESGNEIRTALMTIGCDGHPNINPLDGTSCNDVGINCGLVLYNTTTRTVMTDKIGRAYAGTGAACVPSTIGFALVEDCPTLLAHLKAKRRFVDSAGNTYGPTGGLLSSGDSPAQLETAYVHRFEIGKRFRYGDPPTWQNTGQLALLKTTGAIKAEVLLTYSGSYTLSGMQGASFPGQAQGLVYPSVNDTTSTGLVTVFQGEYDPTGTHYYFAGTGLNDAQFDTSYFGTQRIDVMIVPVYSVEPSAALDDLSYNSNFSAYHDPTVSGIFDVEIDGLATPRDTFKWRKNGGSWTTGVSVGNADHRDLSDGMWIQFENSTGHTLGDAWVVKALLGNATALRPDSFFDPVGNATHTITGGWQSFGSSNIRVKFGARYGHLLFDRWSASTAANNVIVRPGVAVRGTIMVPTPCINMGKPNNNIILTAELNANFQAFGTSPTATGSHALVVRDADTLALLYRKPLTHDATGYAWGNPPEAFSFSTNAEGVFFMHCYTTPTLSSPPSPYPGAEFGAPDRRKIAVIAVNPTTFEPTIQELITLEGTGGTFAVVKTISGAGSTPPVSITLIGDSAAASVGTVTAHIT